LDGWRGVAIGSLLVGHFTPLPGIDFGRVGVELFFVLSGRLMADILFVRNFALPAFFRRRIARIWPALVFFVLAIAIENAIFDSGQVSGLDILTALTFTINYVSAFGHRVYVFDHIWSLCVEEHAYVFLALVAFIARKRLANPVVLCLGAAVCSMLSGVFQSLVLHGQYHQVYWRTDARVASILLSSAFYLLIHENKNLYSRLPRITPICFGVAGLILSSRAIPDAVIYTGGTLCFALSICSIDRAPAFVLWTLRTPVMVRLGLWSYSLYLWQQPFRVERGELHPVVMFVGAFACALVSFYVVEQPVRRFLNQYWGTGKLRSVILGDESRILSRHNIQRVFESGWLGRLKAWRREGRASAE